MQILGGREMVVDSVSTMISSSIASILSGCESISCQLVTTARSDTLMLF